MDFSVFNAMLKRQNDKVRRELQGHFQTQVGSNFTFTVICKVYLW